jgi:hypothetical protein
VSWQKVPCQACGLPMLFAKNPDTGKLIPLDTRTPVYHVTKDAEGNPIAVRAESTYCSHFGTCKDPGRFSGGGKR